MKLSLRYFALWKKKQHEEQKEREKDVQVKEREREKVVVGLESPRIPMTSPLLEPDVPEIATATEVPSLNPVGMGSVKGDPDGDVKMADADEDLKARVTIKEDTKEPGEEQQPPAKAVNGMHDAHTLDNADRVWPIEEPPPPPVVKEATSDFVVPIPNGHSTYSSTRRSPTPDLFFYGRRKTSEPTWDDKRHRSPSPDYSQRRRIRSRSFERRRVRRSSRLSSRRLRTNEGRPY